MKKMKKIMALVLSLVMILSMFGCSKDNNDADETKGTNENDNIGEISGTIVNNVKEFANATDFGGEIALVEQKTSFGELSNSYICINSNGKKLFTLPEKIFPAYDAIERDVVAPVNNYIFADDRDSFSCKYVLNKFGEIILSPEKNGFDGIFILGNYREMFCDGYVLAFKNSHTYNSNEQMLSCYNLDGNIFFENKKLLEYDINEMIYSPYYLGNGILQLYGYEYLNLKTGTIFTDIDYPVKSTVNNSENYDFSLPNNSVNISEVAVDGGRMYSIYKGKCGVGYYNYDNDTYYVGVININQEFLFEPIAVESEFEKICVYDDGFIIVPKSDGYEHRTEFDIPFYNFDGELVRIVSIKTDLSGKFEISDFSCGFFKLKKGGNLINYLSSDGELLF